MENIPFLTFMQTYNFRECYNSEQIGEADDTQIIRIHYSHIYTDEPTKNDWFEFGIYDFGPPFVTENNLRCIFNDKIINSYVSTFRMNTNTNCFEIWLTKEKSKE